MCMCTGNTVKQNTNLAKVNALFIHAYMREVLYYLRERSLFRASSIDGELQVGTCGKKKKVQITFSSDHSLSSYFQFPLLRPSNSQFILQQGRIKDNRNKMSEVIQSHNSIFAKSEHVCSCVYAWRIFCMFFFTALLLLLESESLQMAVY